MDVNIVETFVKQFMATWQMARIYEIRHPKFITALDEMYEMLTGLLSHKDELVIGIFADELACGEEIFFDLSRKVIASIDYLKNLGIERLAIAHDVSKEECIKFFSFLMTPIDQIQANPQEHLSTIGIKNITVAKIKAGLVPFSTSQKASAVKLAQYQACLENAAQSIEALINDDIIDSLRLRFVSNKIMDSLMGDHQLFLELGKVKGHDISTFMHMLNVSILAMYFAYKLGFGRTECINISIAALFHDIGKLYISKKILQKPGSLDTGEFEQVKSHTLLGTEILLRHTETLTLLPSVVAFEHHLGWDTAGYPPLVFPRKPHLASFLVAICDVYDAFSQRRTYKTDYPSETIYAIMVRDRGKRYHPVLLDGFFRIVGVWPKGTIVELDDQRIAIVREVNEEDIFSPTVEIVSEKEKMTVDLHAHKDLKIRRSLNSLSEGEKYLEFI